MLAVSSARTSTKTLCRLQHTLRVACVGVLACGHPAWEILARGHPMALGWQQDPARPAWEVLAYGTPWDKNGITFKTIVSESNTKMVLLSKTVFLNVVPKWYYF